MPKIYLHIKMSQKGNAYLSISYYINKQRVSTFVMNGEWEKAKDRTKGKENLWSALWHKIDSLQDGKPVGNIKAHKEDGISAVPLPRGWWAAQTNVATIAGTPVGADGLYLVSPEGIAYQWVG